MMREEGLKVTALLSHMNESIVSFFECLIGGYGEGKGRSF